jgi:hypothetical protein
MCVASCRTQVALSSIIAILDTIIFLFVIVCSLDWNRTLSRGGCPINLNSYFLILWISVDLAQHVQSNLHQHLFAATDIFLSVQNVPMVHCAVRILHDLENITYCSDDAALSYDYRYLVRSCMSGILKWADTLINYLKVGVLYLYTVMFTFLIQSIS